MHLIIYKRGQDGLLKLNVCIRMGKKCDLKDSECGKVFSARLACQNISETDDLQGFFLTQPSLERSQNRERIQQVAVNMSC